MEQIPSKKPNREKLSVRAVEKPSFFVPQHYDLLSDNQVKTGERFVQGLSEFVNRN
jgi:hypothetical protein